jgi:hypothetical protein
MGAKRHIGVGLQLFEHRFFVAGAEIDPVPLGEQVLKNARFDPRTVLRGQHPVGIGFQNFDKIFHFYFVFLVTFVQ